MLNRGWRTPDGQRGRGSARPARPPAAGARGAARPGRPRAASYRRGGRGAAGGAGRGAAPASTSSKSDARHSGDQRRQEVTDEVATERRMQLDLLPTDLAGTVRELQQYEFVSSDARQHFEELMERLREEVARTYFEQMSEALANPDPDAAGPHARRLRRPQPDDRAAGGRRGARPVVRGVHGAVRRPVPRRPGRPRRAARAAGRPDGGRPGHVELDVARAAIAAAGAGRVPAGGHGSAVAGRPPGRATSRRPSPMPGGSSATGSAGTSRWGWATAPTPPPACATSTSSRRSCGRPTHRPRCPRSTWTRWPSTWARTPPGRSTGWPSWPSSSPTPGSSTSARAASS